MLANSVDPDEMRFDFYFWHAKREKFVEIVTQQSKLSWRGGGGGGGGIFTKSREKGKDMAFK